MSSQHADAILLHDILRNADIRCRMYDENETLSRRIVSARAQEVPVHAVIGQREATNGEVAVKIAGRQEIIVVDRVSDHLRNAFSADSVP
ncbi:His/Gly/Thr/Pro-type tRNA ligase C-terminal domain-containing protein [Salipiger mucosus]|uniref:His/Gly/Thr/Pro-type tRNA ligase C-terminal domain-containing protein n=1 Tax=Salipiger mucosus TaxID=263378 RepID=UPI000382F260|nr:His/Gly/Thr/Pro-type tRNA ligase C-terminal domain-containing protein [Salipiger mucosus]